MDEEKQQENKVKYISLSLIGDKDNCEHCKAGDHMLSEKYKDNPKIKYNYVSVDTEDGQGHFTEEGYKENDKIGIPHIQACVIEELPDGTKKKGQCKETKEFHEADWKSIDNDKLPDEISLNLDE